MITRKGSESTSLIKGIREALYGMGMTQIKLIAYSMAIEKALSLCEQVREELGGLSSTIAFSL
jgi:hypothetical protein